ncbi:MAG: DNA-3-methyladenine glycosylase 2 family protein, partial [Oscillospiraceae bacterium]|nr:DNA-3-methyladenine glycosylase 2 family protein [Oscillospiraceae bacterium]
MQIKEVQNGILVSGERVFSPSLCLDCGQAFRWEQYDNVWHGVAKGRSLSLQQTKDGVLFYSSPEDFYDLWFDYFDLSRDYSAILESFKDDEHLNLAALEFCGIRILNQDPWEALCSFIISQNNNIPRIKGIIKRLCENFGKPLGYGDYSFPGPQVIAGLTLDDLAPLRAGFRNKYILDAAQKISCGEVNLNHLHNMPIELAQDELIKIKGVGAKVAACTLLYGCRHMDSFPIDVWVSRILSEL